jgi:hypothetical protein
LIVEGSSVKPFRIRSFLVLQGSLSLSPFSHLAASPARHRDDESREPPLSACAGEEEAQPMLARFRKKTRRNKGNKIESEEKRPYVKTRFFTSRKRRRSLSLLSRVLLHLSLVSLK